MARQHNTQNSPELETWSVLTPPLVVPPTPRLSSLYLELACFPSVYVLFPPLLTCFSSNTGLFGHICGITPPLVNFLNCHRFLT